MSKRKRVSKNEFRYNYDTKHMNYVFEEDGNQYHALGLTHKSKFNKTKNLPLEQNPKVGESGKSYIRSGYITRHKKTFSRKADNRFKFSSNDFSKVKSKIRKYKSKRKKLHKKNKHLCTGYDSRR